MLSFQSCWNFHFNFNSLPTFHPPLVSPPFLTSRPRLVEDTFLLTHTGWETLCLQQQDQKCFENPTTEKNQKLNTTSKENHTQPLVVGLPGNFWQQSGLTHELTFVVGLQLWQWVDCHLAQWAVQQLLGLVLLCLRVGRAAGGRSAGGSSSGSQLLRGGAATAAAWGGGRGDQGRGEGGQEGAHCGHGGVHGRGGRLGKSGKGPRGQQGHI